MSQEDEFDQSTVVSHKANTDFRKPPCRPAGLWWGFNLYRVQKTTRAYPTNTVCRIMEIETFMFTLQDEKDTLEKEHEMERDRDSQTQRERERDLNC